MYNTIEIYTIRGQPIKKIEFCVINSESSKTAHYAVWKIEARCHGWWSILILSFRLMCLNSKVLFIQLCLFPKKEKPN